MTRKLFTIGYEGAHLDTFLATLALAGINHVVDVRDVPISRKRGFSKTTLAQALAVAGIKYTHLKPLGDPKPGREAMKRGDFPEFRRIYQAHIDGDEAQDALDGAASIASMSNAVLLCYERNPKQCHRTIVAEQLVRRGNFEIRHLGVVEGRNISSTFTPESSMETLVYRQA